MRQQTRPAAEEAAHKYDKRVLKQHGFHAFAALAQAKPDIVPVASEIPVHEPGQLWLAWIRPLLGAFN